MYQEEVHSYFHLNKDRDISLGLTTIDSIAGLYGFRNMYSFLHLTFQEYLAAFYISTLSNEEQLELVEVHGKEDHMLQVWKFLCGLQGDKFASIYSKTIGKILFHVQCVYESQQPIVCTELVTAVESNIWLKGLFLSVPDFTALGYIANASKIPFNLSLRNCNIDIEAVDSMLSEMSDNTGQLIGLNIDPVCSIDMECVRKLLSTLSSLKCVTIRAVDKVLLYSELDTIARIKLPDVIELVVINTEIGHFNLLHDLSYDKLTKLNLRGSIGRSIYIEPIKDGLHCCTQLKELDLSANNLNEVDAKLLASGLKWCENLKRIYVNNNRITKSGICAVLKSLGLLSHLKLYTSDIIENDFNDQDLPIFLKPISGLRSLVIKLNSEVSDSLLSNSRHWKRLKELSIVLLQPYNIGATAAICKSLPNFCALRKLQLKNSISTVDRAKDLMSGLSGCSELEHVDLSDNFIGPSEIQIIASSLPQFTHLKSLNLDNNRLHDLGAAYLLPHLKDLHSLQNLSLVNNSISTKHCRIFTDNLKHLSQLRLNSDS